MSADRAESLKMIQDGLRDSAGLFEDIRLLQSELEQLSSPWDEQWSALIKRVADKAHVYLGEILRHIGDSIGLELSINRPCMKFGEVNEVVRKAASFALVEKLKKAARSSVKDLIVLAKKTLKPDMMQSLRDFSGILDVWREGLGGVVGQTSAECAFQDEYSKDIVSLIKFLGGFEEEAKYNVGTFPSTFQVLINGRLLKRLNKAKGGNGERRKLSRICPNFLGLFKDDAAKSKICLPMTSEKGGVSFIKIAGVLDQVEVLESKTNPKKIMFFDEFKREHAFLLKRSEDLRVDERIMQALNATNTLLAYDKSISARNLRIRTYTVLPTSSMCGLIEFVEGPVSMYTLFEHHQQRMSDRDELVGKILQTGEKSIVHNDNLRSMFFKEVGEVMTRRENGKGKGGGEGGEGSGNNNSNKHRIWKRKLLPKDVLMEVYANLKKKVPAKLLSNEIFCSSSSTSNWFDKQTMFVRSMAAASVLGHVFGLGDRHPNNLLLDFSTGEVVHIDYGVIFDVGKTLAVPEIVPFRLTQSIVKALGVLGVDGPFKVNFEKVLRVVKSNRETLLTLLEAFIHDPVMMRGYGARSKLARQEDESIEADDKKKQAAEVEASADERTVAAMMEDSEKLADGMSTLGLKIAKLKSSTKQNHIKVCSVVDTAMVLPGLAQQLGASASREFYMGSSSVFTAKYENFLRVNCTDMQNFLQSKMKVAVAIDEAIMTNKPFEEQLPIWTAYKHQFYKMCQDGQAQKIGIVSDLYSLVETTLETLLWCSKLIDEYKQEKERIGGKIDAGSVYKNWLECIKRAKMATMSTAGGKQAMRASNITSILEEARRHQIDPGGEVPRDLMGRFVEKRDAVELIMRKCDNISRHLPVLSKRLGPLGKNICDMFASLQAIVGERLDIFAVICDIEGFKSSKDKARSVWEGEPVNALADSENDRDDNDRESESDGNINVLIDEFFEELLKSRQDAEKERAISGVLKRLKEFDTGEETKEQGGAVSPGRKGSFGKYDASNSTSSGGSSNNSNSNGKKGNPVSPLSKSNPNAHWPKSIVDELFDDKDWSSVMTTLSATPYMPCDASFEVSSKKKEGWQELWKQAKAALILRQSKAKALKIILSKSTVAEVKVSSAAFFNCEPSKVGAIGELLQAELKKFDTCHDQVIEKLQRMVEYQRVMCAGIREELSRRLTRLHESGGGAGTCHGRISPAGRVVEGRSIIRLIQGKLSARDSGNRGGSRCGEAEQIIQQATDDDNLAHMYEGWCSWF